MSSKARRTAKAKVQRRRRSAKKEWKSFILFLIIFISIFTAILAYILSR
ncbi:MAG: hypothetical protein ACTSRZ_16260 [Promethearchaeota archaeon]